MLCGRKKREGVIQVIWLWSFKMRRTRKDGRCVWNSESWWLRIKMNRIFFKLRQKSRRNRSKIINWWVWWIIAWHPICIRQIQTQTCTKIYKTYNSTLVSCIKILQTKASSLKKDLMKRTDKGPTKKIETRIHKNLLCKN